MQQTEKKTCHKIDGIIREPKTQSVLERWIFFFKSLESFHSLT